MGQSTDAIIAYGFDLGEDHELPWAEHDGIEEWWDELTGFEPSDYPFDENECYDDTPERRERVEAYFAERAEWRREHPLPIQEIRHCSGDYPMIFIAAKGSQIRAHRGYPKPFAAQDLVESVGVREADQLIQFCIDHKIERPNPIGWQLFSMWS